MCFYGLTVKTVSLAWQESFLRTGCQDREYSFAKEIFSFLFFHYLFFSFSFLTLFFWLNLFPDSYEKSNETWLSSQGQGV